MRFLLIITPHDDGWKVTAYDQSDMVLGEPIGEFTGSTMTLVMAHAQDWMRSRVEIEGLA